MRDLLYSAIYEWYNARNRQYIQYKMVLCEFLGTYLKMVLQRNSTMRGGVMRGLVTTCTQYSFNVCYTLVIDPLSSIYIIISKCPSSRLRICLSIINSQLCIIFVQHKISMNLLVIQQFILVYSFVHHKMSKNLLVNHQSILVYTFDVCLSTKG